MYKDILLALPAWPKAASGKAIRKAVNVAHVLDAHLTCTIAEPRVSIPVAFHPYSRDLERLLDTRQKDVRDAAQTELDAFETTAEAAGLSHEGHILKVSDGSDAPDPIIDFARLRDLSIVPAVADDTATADLVQALIFETGRPVLLLPDNDEDSFSLDRVVVAWDGGRPAARAVADAMPLLQRAKEVVIVTVQKDKALSPIASGAELAAHLARNGVKATHQSVDKGNRFVGEVLDAATADADLVVMGAFGHSRIRDFFMGGATAYVLKKTLRPTLLAH